VRKFTVAKRTRSRSLGRLESFSDAVFAIALTLLVLDLLPKGVQSPSQLLADWPTYLAYLASFITIGITWLNHNQQMARVQNVNPVVMVLNLGILLGTSMVPWPTALASSALTRGDRASQIAAIFVFAVVTLIISIPWLILDNYLARHEELLRSELEVKWMRAHARASIGTIVGAVIGFGIAFIWPLGALVLYLVIGGGFLALRLRETGTAAASFEDE
jgi:uncharacterized membrane protein